jgi:hypothetical protein
VKWLQERGVLIKKEKWVDLEVLNQKILDTIKDEKIVNKKEKKNMLDLL